MVWPIVQSFGTLAMDEELEVEPEVEPEVELVIGLDTQVLSRHKMSVPEQPFSLGQVVTSSTHDPSAQRTCCELEHDCRAVQSVLALTTQMPFQHFCGMSQGQPLSRLQLAAPLVHIPSAHT